MSGIKHYPSRDQLKLQKVVETNSNIAVTYNDIGKLYYCYNSGSTLSISVADDNAIPVGSQFDFIRMADDVQFPAGNGYSYYSSVGSTPKIREVSSACTLIKIALYEWAVVGDIVAS